MVNWLSESRYRIVYLMMSILKFVECHHSSKTSEHTEFLSVGIRVHLGTNKPSAAKKNAFARLDLVTTRRMFGILI